MSMLDRYKDFLVKEHCPRFCDLADALGIDVNRILVVASDKFLAGELSGVYGESDNICEITPYSDIAAEDVPIIIAEIESDELLRGNIR